ncbi:hypothetical protein GCM10025787_33740 [Saccharopolyspora rosea]|uniref:non-specific serine/threonine protein kinase n=1 Tax=Saccharopolyspora rosea TaxID=524884 RepID=A0ABW3FT78_9PSEU
MTAPTTTEPEPLREGQEIAPGYRVIEHMRRGSELDTYDAWSEQRYSRCFIKTVRPDQAREERVRRCLESEARLLLGFTHPHIVRAYELVERPDGPVLVMETLSGATLSHIIEARNRRLPARDIAHLGLHLCSAMRYMHDRGYLHLDLKPGNIIADAGRARIIDLNLARPPGLGHGYAGTPCYMAPEQVRGGVLGPAADVWGVGLVLYEAATGHQPFDRGDEPPEQPSEASWTSFQQRCPQLTEPVPPVRTRRRLPATMADAVDACLAREPAKRPTLAELSRALTTVTEIEEDAPVPHPSADLLPDGEPTQPAR